MAQSRQKLARLRPAVGDTFIDTLRRPVLMLEKDTSNGVHDILYPPCDGWRYTEAGVPGHDSCATNLREGLQRAAQRNLDGNEDQKSPLQELEASIRKWGWTPEPLNLFMNAPIGSAADGAGSGALQVKKPDCKKGCHVVLRAEMDCLVVMSACPNDLLDTNGGKAWRCCV